MTNTIGSTHRLALTIRSRVIMTSLLMENNYQVGDPVIYQQERHEIVSIYSEASPLCGYMLITGVGEPVLVSEIEKCK